MIVATIPSCWKHSLLLASVPLYSPSSYLSGFSSVILLTLFFFPTFQNSFLVMSSLLIYYFFLDIFIHYPDFNHHQTKSLNPLVQSHISTCSLQVYTGCFTSTSNMASSKLNPLSFYSFYLLLFQCFLAKSSHFSPSLGLLSSFRYFLIQTVHTSLT